MMPLTKYGYLPDWPGSWMAGGGGGGGALRPKLMTWTKFWSPLLPSGQRQSLVCSITDVRVKPNFYGLRSVGPVGSRGYPLQCLAVLEPMSATQFGSVILSQLGFKFLPVLGLWSYHSWVLNFGLKKKQFLYHHCSCSLLRV